LRILSKSWNQYAVLLIKTEPETKKIPLVHLDSTKRKMPVSKNKNECWGDIMGEFKRGQLSSGKDKKNKVKSEGQAKAIAASTCNNSEYKKKKEHMMALGYSEQSAEVIAQGLFPTDFSEDHALDMLTNRLQVMHARLSDIEKAIEGAMQMSGEVEMAPWMVDKITLAADYISAVADNALYGDGLSSEEDSVMTDEMMMDQPYGEKKGLWANIHAKRERIKRGSGERMRKPGEKGAPSAADLKDASKDDKKK